MELSGITEKIIKIIKSRIITCVYAPGQRLNEIEIAEELGVSRTPIREAIRVLAEQRLLVNIPRKGTYVTEISASDLEHLFTSRLMIERQAVNLIARDPNSPEYILRIENNMDETEHFLKGLTSDEYLERNDEITRRFREFHLILQKCADNPWLEYFYSIIDPAVARYLHIYLSISGNVKRSIDNHRSFITTYKEQGADSAAEVLTNQIKLSYNKINEHLFRKSSTLKELDMPTPVDFAAEKHSFSII